MKFPLFSVAHIHRWGSMQVCLLGWRRLRLEAGRARAPPVRSSCTHPSMTPYPNVTQNLDALELVSVASSERNRPLAWPIIVACSLCRALPDAPFGESLHSTTHTINFQFIEYFLLHFYSSARGEESHSNGCPRKGPILGRLHKGARAEQSRRPVGGCEPPRNLSI